MKSWFADIHTIGWHKEVPTVILVEMRGPNGGKIGFGQITPDEARRAAQELLDAAEIVESLDGPNIQFRGYKIEPQKAGQRCQWHQADRFVIHPPNGPALDRSPRTFNEAQDAVLEDINGFSNS
jgi:hypothetical protein